MLTTQRCIIRKIDTSDREFYFEMQKNAYVRQYLGGIQDNGDLESKFQEIVWSTDLYFVVIEKESNEKIGIISIDTYYDGISKELSYEFIDSSWGKGYAYESISETLDYVSKNLSIKHVIAETQSKNKSSVTLLKKLGFIFQEEVERHGEEQKVLILEKS